MNNISSTQLCEQVRKVASKTLLQTLNEIWGSPFTEKQLKKLWLARIRKNKNLLPSGWYAPPPDGISVLIASQKDQHRLNYDSLRKPVNWPGNTAFHPQEGIVQVYASPVDKSGIIGDFGMTLYAGKDSDLINHFKKMHKITLKVAGMIKCGLKVKEFYRQALDIFEENNVSNTTLSITDLTKINIGHNIPGTIKPFSAKEKKTIKGLNMKKISNLISEKRIFINKKENYIFKVNDCFTVEPQLINNKNTGLPVILFHVIVVVAKGKVKILENFKKIFKSVGMDYMF